MPIKARYIIVENIMIKLGNLISPSCLEVANIFSSDWFCNFFNYVNLSYD